MKKRGTPDEKLFAIDEYKTDPIFSHRERVALSYAEAMTFPNIGVDGVLFRELQASFSDDEIVELTALIGFQNMSSKFNAALDVPSQGFCLTSEKRE